MEMRLVCAMSALDRKLQDILVASQFEICICHPFRLEPFAMANTHHYVTTYFAKFLHQKWSLVVSLLGLSQQTVWIPSNFNMESLVSRWWVFQPYDSIGIVSPNMITSFHDWKHHQDYLWPSTSLHCNIQDTNMVWPSLFLSVQGIIISHLMQGLYINIFWYVIARFEWRLSFMASDTDCFTTRLTYVLAKWGSS